MAVRFGDHLDITQKQLLNAVLHGVTVDPPSPLGGQIWYRTDLNRLSWYDGSIRRSAFRLDQLEAPTGSVELNGQRITNLGAPTAAGDAVTKTYADGLMQGVRWKEPVDLATTANITLSGNQAIDGVTTTTGMRILVKNQTTGSQNGIYLADAGTWTRTNDADTATELQGAAVLVQQGTAQADSIWQQTADGVTLGTTALVWAQISGLADLNAGAGLVKSGNVLDVVAADGSITVAADSITVGNVPLTKGGTGGTTAATARTNLDVLTGLVGGAGIAEASVSAGAKTLNVVAADGSLTVNANDMTVGNVPITKGGTGATTAAGALTNLGAVGKYVVTVVGGAVRTITHGLAATKDHQVYVYDETTPFDQVMVGVRHPTTTTVTVDLTLLPATNFRVVVIG